MEKQVAKIRQELGKIHIYAGDGKGKTTAAMGQALRSAGAGLNVLIMQFLKDGKSSELNILKEIPNIQILESNPVKKFIFTMTEAEKAETKNKTETFFQEAKDIIAANQIDLFILDESIGAIATGMLSEADIVDFLKSKPQGLEVVMTGRDPSQTLINLADYYSEIRAIKHPYNTEQLKARKGIEF